MALKLPPGYSVENGTIVRRWTDKKGEHAEVIANGMIQVITVVKYTDSSELFLIARFTSINAVQYEDIQLPVKQVTGNGKKLLDFVPDWFVLLAPSPAKRLSFLQQTLNIQRVEIKEVVNVQRVGPGYHTTDDGTLFYVLGNMVLNRPPDVNIEVVTPFHLLDENGPHGQDIVWDRTFCEQGPPQAALFVAALTAYIRPILEATNNFDRFGIFIAGESGIGKTTGAKLLCQLFDEESGAALSSDKPDILREMSLYRDLPFLVDDLNDSHISSAMNKKMERLSEILQQLSGTGVLSIRGETFDVGRTIPIVTAESLLKSYSTIDRVLVVSFEKPFDVGTMTWLQQHRDLYVDFLKGFIEWICRNHTRLETAVRSWKFANLNGGKNPDAYVGFNRLMRTFKILKITVALLLLHLREVYSLPKEDEISWQRMLDDGINQSVFVDTLKHLCKESKENERIYVDAVLDIFDDERQLHGAKNRLVAASFEKYVELNKRASIDARIPRKIFFESADGEYYCYRGDDLIEYLAAKDDNQYIISKKAVSEQLDYHGLLQRKWGDLSYPIAKSKQNDRYYHLRKKTVEQLQKERRDEFLAKVDKMVIGGGGNDDQDWIIPRQ